MPRVRKVWRALERPRAKEQENGENQEKEAEETRLPECQGHWRGGITGVERAAMWRRLGEYSFQLMRLILTFSQINR
jgi:hypothetical protein